MIFSLPEFWVDLAFLLLAVGVFIKAKPRVKVILDEKIRVIALELSEARDLREQSFRYLAEVQFRDKNAEPEVERILKEAKAEVEVLRRHARKQREGALRRARVRAKEKMVQLERVWERRLRGSIAAAALGAAEVAVLSAMREEGVQRRYFERAMGKVPHGWLEESS